MAKYRSVAWALDDDMAETIEPGLVLRLDVVVRFEDVAEYADGSKAWMTSVLEVGRTHD